MKQKNILTISFFLIIVLFLSGCDTGVNKRGINFNKDIITCANENGQVYDMSSNGAVLCCYGTIFQKCAGVCPPNVLGTCVKEKLPELKISDGCPDARNAYLVYVRAYNGLTSLTAAGKGETPESIKAYEVYKFFRACYDAIPVSEFRRCSNEKDIPAKLKENYEKLNSIVTQGNAHSKSAQEAYEDYMFYKSCSEED